MSRPVTEADRQRAAKETLDHVQREVGKQGGNTEKARQEAAESIRRQERRNRG